MNKLKIVVIAALIMLSAAMLYATPVSENGQLHVSGLQLTNACGFPVQLRGVSTHGIYWYQTCYTPAMLDFVAYTLNADVFRIAMYSYEGTGYTTDPVWNTAKVKSLVDMATARGMYAIIDWHILADANPNSFIAQAQVFFTEMANTYKDNNNVIYEICNEPNTAAVTWAVIKNYANVIVPMIRLIDPDAVIIVGTPNYSQLGAAVVASPLAYSNIMYAFHFYAGTHVTSMLTSYISQLPIFVTEWGVSNSTGNGGDNYARASQYMNIMDGSDTVGNTVGVKISWAMWSLASNSDSSSMFPSGKCGLPSYSLADLSASGTYVYDKINNPSKNFVCGTNTFTPTFTPYAGTPTPTYTITETATALSWDLIYDGDTAGYTLADGVAVSNALLNANATPVGTIAEKTGGNPGNGMDLKYVSTGWWEGHSWRPTIPKVVGTNNNIEFEVKAVTGSVRQFLLKLDNQALQADVGGYTPGDITTSWKTVRIPLNAFYSFVPASISEFDFISNWASNDYTVMIDNIRLVAVPTFSPTISKTITFTRTYTSTATITQTHTVSPTRTITQTITKTKTATPSYTASLTSTNTPIVTITQTATITQTSVPVNARRPNFVDVANYISYPNPTTGDKVTFRYTISGFAEKLTINIYTFGERKIYSVLRTNLAAGTYFEVWRPTIKLANGLYYYTIEGTNGSRPISRHVAAFFVNGQVPTQ